MLFNRKKNIQKLSEEDLILKFKRTGDSIYVGILFQRFTPLITSICLNYMKDKVSAEDTVMDVFEVLMRDLKTHEVQNFKAWLYSVTKNCCLKKIRKISYEKKNHEEFAKNILSDVELSTSLDLLDNELLDNQINALKMALSNLSEEQRNCVELFYYENKSYHEIAEITGYSLKQVKSYIQNGKKNLGTRIARIKINE